MRREGALLALGALSATAGVLACSSVLGFKDLYLEADATTDAGSDSAAASTDASDGGTPRDAAASEASTTCPLGGNSLPSRPTTDDGKGDTQIVLAMEVADFGLPADAGALPNPPGLNLDCVWTCPQPSSCGDPCPQLPCDDDGGRDVAANALMGLLSTFEPAFSPEQLNRDIGLGRFGLVLRIDQFNGTANDTQVDVEVYPSSGTIHNDAGVPIPPRHDGTDLWLPTSAGLPGGDAGTTVTEGVFTDTAAYVTNGVLVFHVAASDSPAAAFPLFISPLAGSNDNPVTFHLQYVVGTATLAQDDAGAWHAENGNVTGRWPATEALRGISTLSDALTGHSICGDDPIFTSFAYQLCPALDIATSPTNDNLSPPAPCDALSFGIAFRAGPANLAVYPWDPPVVPGDCPDAWAPTCGADSGINWTCQ